MNMDVLQLQQRDRPTVTHTTIYSYPTYIPSQLLLLTHVTLRALHSAYLCVTKKTILQQQQLHQFTGMMLGLTSGFLKNSYLA